MHLTGLGSLYRIVRPVGGATILMYHSVPAPAAARHVDPANAMDPKAFGRQMTWLARHRSVISMTRLVGELAARRTPPAGTVVLTFDDGYLDNLEVAAPILTALKLPATLYLATGYVTREEPQWIDQVYSAFRHRTRDVIVISGAGEHRLETGVATRRAYADACGAVLRASPAQRRALLQALRDQLEPREVLPRLTLGWEDVRTLVSHHPLFEVGVHTREHSDLTKMSPDQVAEEIRTSIEDVLRETGRRPEHFSFPYGRQSGNSAGVIRSLGLRSAIVGGPAALVNSRSDPIALPRMAAPTTPVLLAFFTSGAYPGLSHVLLRRA